MDIAGGLAAVGQAITLARTLRTLDKAVDAAEYRSTIADLMEAAADAKLALTEARETLARKDAEIAELKASFEIRQSLVEGPGSYLYRVDSDGNKLGYPYCPKCERVDGKMSQLVQNGVILNAKCPVCATEYQPVESFAAPAPGEPDTNYARHQKRQNDAMRRLNQSRRRSVF